MLACNQAIFDNNETSHKKDILHSRQLGVAEQAELQEFTESLYWARNVIMHNGLGHVRLWGEARLVDRVAIAQEVDITIELSHKLLQNISTLETSICGAVQVATSKCTLFSLQLAKRLPLLSLTHT